MTDSDSGRLQLRLMKVYQKCHNIRISDQIFFNFHVELPTNLNEKYIIFSILNMYRLSYKVLVPNKADDRTE